MQILKRNIDLICILVIGFALRFSISITHAYTNDELSAINRLRYDSFSELIESGVKKGDMHPAGVQVFEKLWSSIFGTSELSLRLPFVLFGTASIFMIFLLGWKWFNRSTGIIAATLLSLLYFPILQSELARPYSPGLLIALLTAWFYYKVLFCEIKKYKNAIFLGLSFAAGMYIHYFLFLFLLFVGVSGLLFLKKENFKMYFLAAGIAMLLYTPHISVTLYHLSVGGLGWLGAPDNSFLVEFIFEAFNQSWYLIILLLSAMVASIFLVQTQEHFKTTYYRLCAGWFFGIYLVGHILSLISTPVLKAPVMLFSLPFFLLMIAYLLSRLPFQKIFVSVLLIITFCSTWFEKDLFGIQHQGFKHTASTMIKWNQEYGAENIYSVYNVNNPDYLNFYASQLGEEIKLDRSIIEFQHSEEIRNELKYAVFSQFCVVGYAEKLTLPQVFEIALDHFPNIVEYYRYDNSAVFLLSREDPGGLEPKEEIFSAMDLYEPNTASWKLNSDFIISDSIHQELRYELNEKNPYGPDFTFKKSDADRMNHYYLKIKVKARCPHNGQLTVAFTAKRNGTPIQNNGEDFWMGYDLEPMLIDSKNDFSGEGEAFWAFEIPDFILPEDDITLSLWNRNGNPIQLSQFEIRIVENIWN